MPSAPLIGSVFERKTSSPKNPITPANATGFPTAQHRSKSAFARAREDAKRQGERGSAAQTSRVREAPVIVGSGVSTPPAQSTVLPNPRSFHPSLGDDSRGALQEADWRKQISDENERRVAEMSEEERAQEREEILARFGGNISEVLSKARAKRQHDGAASGSAAALKSKELTSIPPQEISEDIHGHQPLAELPTTPPQTPKRLAPILINSSSPPSRLSTRPSTPTTLSAGGTRPSSRADKKLRFADVTPSNVHVYESAPSSPKRKALALPPPNAEEDRNIVSLGVWKGASSLAKPKAPSTLPKEDHPAENRNHSTPITPDVPKDDVKEENDDVEEGTPEYIRRRFFPQVPAGDPSLEWIQGSFSPSSNKSDEVRLDLSGRPIPHALSDTLPTHLGLHHHAEGTRAGYTLDDIFLLARSTVPAQRAAMLGVMCGLAAYISPSPHSESGGSNVDPDISEELSRLQPHATELRSRMLAAGITTMTERGGIGARAIELIWRCIVGWDQRGIESLFSDKVELRTGPEKIRDPEDPQDLAASQPDGSKANNDSITSISLDYFLPTISDLLTSASALALETQRQLLSILHRLAQHSNRIAALIVKTPKLVAHTLRVYLLTPIPPKNGDPLPNVDALRLLVTLVRASRENALALLEPIDSLMRFVASGTPDTSPFLEPLAAELIAGTLELYAALAAYGLYAQVATTASVQLAAIAAYAVSQPFSSHKLKVRHAWARALQNWLVCARDPHHTTPDHDILWSQVVGWGWNTDVNDLTSLLETGRSHWPMWSAAWQARSAWLEGARVNGVRGGEAERGEAIRALKEGFATGKESTVIWAAGDALGIILNEVTNATDASLPPKLAALHEPAMVLASALRIWLACCPPGDDVLNQPPLQLPFIQLERLLGTLITHSLWNRVLYTPGADSRLYVLCRSLTTLLALYPRLSRRMPTTSRQQWLAQILSLPSRLLPGDEEAGRILISNALQTVDTGLLQSLGISVTIEFWERGGMGIIEPFFTQSLRPSIDWALAPLVTTHTSLKVISTQRASPFAGPNTKRGRQQILPLPRDWVFTPLDHLLRSGESLVLQSLPDTWDASETEVVRASLLLTQITRAVLAEGADTRMFAQGREEIVFGCMKVFMLEHNLPETEYEAMKIEVFRDPVVSALMDDLLRPFLLQFAPAAPPDNYSKNNLTSGANDYAPLEIVSQRYLGPSTPFFQFYTDFVALYADISFAHPTFSALILPPLSMRYPTDYRKLLWEEYDRMVPQITTPIELIPTHDISEFLWPVERDGQIFRAYLRALIQGRLAERSLVRLIAVHHVACNIWPDLARDEKVPLAGDGIRLLDILVFQGSKNIVRDVALYRHTRDEDGALLLPPQCYLQDGEWKRQRWESTKKWGKEGLAERLQGLLDN